NIPWEQHTIMDETLEEQDDHLYDYPKGQELHSDALITESDIDSDTVSQMEQTVSQVPYELPPFTILNKPSITNRNSDGTDTYDSRRKLEATLESFGVRAKVLDVVRGP